MCLATVLLCGAMLASAQSAEWRRVGGSAIDMGLAGPATGPVDAVWFSTDGGSLYARTHSGRVFQTSDFETWFPASNPPPPSAPQLAVPARLPESGAVVVTNSWDMRRRMFALGQQLSRSEDDGRTWENIAAYKAQPVIGSGQRSLAMAENSPDQLVVANAEGVWRSMDGGLSWTGLNQLLPNLTVRRIVSTPTSSWPLLAETDNAVLALPPGATVWRVVPGAVPDTDLMRKRRYSSVLGAEITAVASAAQTVYAGASDGRIWTSIDGGATFQIMDTHATGRVERIFVDATRPNVALAALSGKAPHVLHTIGNNWNALDGNLPDASARGVTADRTGGAVYVATDQGVFWAASDLEIATGGLNWTSLSDRLPAAAATDVVLDPAAVQLYAAVDGYGVFATAAPHRQRNVRVVNAADYSTRAAAPGSLLSVIGGKVNAARGGELTYPVLAVVGNESQVQVPFEETGPSVKLALDMAGGPIVRRDIVVQRVSPGIIVSRDGVPLLFDGESGLPLDPKNPARPNMRLQIWAAGLGKVTPDWPTGHLAPLDNPPAVVANVRAFLDGAPVPVTRATLLPGYVGFYLVEVQLPAITNAGALQLYITADGQESNRVILLLQQ